MANCIQCGRKLPPLTLGKKICQWCVQHEAAQRGEETDAAIQRVMPTPWARQGQGAITLTQVLFGANVAVFLAMVLASGSIGDFPRQVTVHFGANVGLLTLSGQWWRLLTYMFLHGGLMHIAFNMWCLWDLGALCESLYGRWTFGAIYLITGIAAGLATVAWNPQVPSVGASGAIFGLAGALVASFALGEFSMPSIAIRGTLRSLVFFVGFNVLFGFGLNLFGGTFGYIDNAAHIGGLVSGLILGALIARAAPESDRPGRRAAVLLLVVLAVAASGFGVYRWRGSSMRFGRSMISIQNNINRLIGELQNKVKQNPQDASAHFSLAHAYFAIGRYPDAEAELKRVLELQPQNTQARMELGTAYLSQDQFKEAQEEFAKVAAQDPNNADAHAALGMALAGQQNHAAAIDEYKTALRLDPQNGDASYRMGVSQAALKRYDDAIASYLNAREQNGDSSELETALADTYQAKGMTQQAQDAKNKAAQLMTGHHD